MIELRKYREQNGVSQRQLAKQLGVVPSTINQYENGVRKPDIVMLKKISLTLGVTTDELLRSVDVNN